MKIHKNTTKVIEQLRREVDENRVELIESLEKVSESQSQLSDAKAVQGVIGQDLRNTKEYLYQLQVGLC